MDSDFNDRFNYLAAFLAVIIGLAAFKDFAANNGLTLFGTRLSYLQLSLPLVISMLLATYLGALTLIIRRWNFTLFPLGGYLETASYSIAAFGLLYPLLIPVALPFSYLASHTNVELLSRTLVLALTVQAFVLGYIANRFALTKERDHLESYLVHVRKHRTERPKDMTTLVDMLERYEYVLAKVKAYLRIRGYGASGSSLGRLAQILNGKGIFSKEDMERARRVTNLRNDYAHAQKRPDPEGIKRTISIIEKLDDRLDELLGELVEENM